MQPPPPPLPPPHTSPLQVLAAATAQHSQRRRCHSAHYNRQHLRSHPAPPRAWSGLLPRPARLMTIRAPAGPAEACAAQPPRPGRATAAQSSGRRHRAADAIDAPCTHRLRHGDPMHAQKWLARPSLSYLSLRPAQPLGRRRVQPRRHRLQQRGHRRATLHAVLLVGGAPCASERASVALCCQPEHGDCHDDTQPRT
jgi:hypothetical protein